MAKHTSKKRSSTAQHRRSHGSSKVALHKSSKLEKSQPTKASISSTLVGRKLGVEDPIMDMPSVPEQVFPLMKLPTELVILISKYATYSLFSINVHSIDRGVKNPLRTRKGNIYNRPTVWPSLPFASHTLLAIAHTCHTLCQIATPLYYSRNEFLFSNKEMFYVFLTAVGQSVASLIVEVCIQVFDGFGTVPIHLVPALEMQKLKILRLNLTVFSWDKSTHWLDNFQEAIGLDFARAAKSLEEVELVLDLIEFGYMEPYGSEHKKEAADYVKGVAVSLSAALLKAGSSAKVAVTYDDSLWDYDSDV